MTVTGMYLQRKTLGDKRGCAGTSEPRLLIRRPLVRVQPAAPVESASGGQLPKTAIWQCFTRSQADRIVEAEFGATPKRPRNWVEHEFWDYARKMCEQVKEIRFEEKANAEAGP